MDLLRASDELCAALAPLRFGLPVTHVYNPLVYARAGYEAYLERAGHGPKRAVFLGMNPGPFGMAQTGVPFGDAELCKSWLGIERAIGRPDPEHPKRPVLGFACHRSEVSGTRVWGAVRDHFGTPERFFARFFIANYCPLCFIEESGRNRTPNVLPKAEREALYAPCDLHLRRLCEVLSPTLVIGVGSFAAERAAIALEGSGIAVAQVLHPSPASPAANVGWLGKVTTQLRELGLCPR